MIDPTHALEQVSRLALCRRPATSEDVARIADYVPCDPALVAGLKKN
jgi:hypothetical protein